MHDPGIRVGSAWMALVDDLHAEFDQGHMRVAIIVDRHRPAIEAATLREAPTARPDGQTVDQLVLQACLRQFGTHRPHCSTVRVSGHKICDCGLTYAIAKYAPPNILRAALATEGEPT